MNSKYLLALPLALLTTGCSIDVQTGPLHNDPISVARDNSEFLRVNLNMGAGDLRLSGGTSQFLEGNLIYNVESWKPAVKYSSAAGHGDIYIAQPGVRNAQIGKANYRWNLRLADNVPLDLTVHFGAGQARLDLGDLYVRTVDVQMGVGELEMDLRGNPRRDYDVRIRGGVGEVTVRLPRDVGVYARAQGGIGSIHASGLRKEGGHYVNDAYDHSKATIHLDVQGGIGAINLVSD